MVEIHIVNVQSELKSSRGLFIYLFVSISISLQILSDDVDILTELNLLDDEEENGDSGDMLPLQMGDLNAIPEQKRFCGMSLCGGKRRKRQRKRPAKRLFCNFGGCYSGKRSTHTRPRFVVSEHQNRWHYLSIETIVHVITF